MGLEAGLKSVLKLIGLWRFRIGGPYLMTTGSALKSVVWCSHNGASLPEVVETRMSPGPVAANGRIWPRSHQWLDSLSYPGLLKDKPDLPASSRIGKISTFSMDFKLDLHGIWKAVSMHWGGPFCGGPDNQHPTTWGLC